MSFKEIRNTDHREKYSTIWKFNQVSINARKSFWLSPLFLAGFLTWLSHRRNQERGLKTNAVIGISGMILALIADIGHAVAHSFSANYAEAPMDEIRLGLDMPRTIYHNNDIQPRQHIQRALGGPIYSGIGLLFSIIWRCLSPPESISRNLADIFSISHGLIFFGVFIPLPAVDGGSILKWSLVDKGVDENDADKIVMRSLIGTITALILLISTIIGYIVKNKRQ